MATVIDTKLAEWEEAGLLTHEQVDAILTAEQAAAGSDDRSSRIPVTVEILGYLGAALALGAAFALSAEYWSDLASWAQVMLLVAVAAVLGIAGIAVRPARDPAVGRMLSVMWAASVVAAGAAVGIGIDAGTDWTGEAAGFIIGLAALALAVPMALAHRRPLQHVVMFAAAALTAVTATTLVVEFDAMWFGFGALAFGSAWLAASLADRLPAPATGEALGAATAIIGAQTLSADTVGPWGELVGLAVAAVLVALGLRRRPKVLLALGVVAVFLFVPQTVFAVFGETAAALVVLFVAGVVLIGFAARRGRGLALPAQKDGAGAEQSGGGEEHQHEEQAGSIR